MENKSHKLDELFKEKLSDMEIPLEEDYWPYIEKKISVPPNSFYRFGWKHFNIYHSSALLLLIGSIYFFTTSKEPKTENTPVPATTNTSRSSDNKADSSVITESVEKETNSFTPTHKIKDKKEAKTGESSASKGVLQRDSSIHIMEEKAENPAVVQEPEKVIPEEKVKPKPKRIIYVVEQDTIIEKDTVKVRRRKKKQ